MEGGSERIEGLTKVTGRQVSSLGCAPCVSGPSIQFFPALASARQAGQALRALQPPVMSSTEGSSSPCLHAAVTESSQPVSGSSWLWTSSAPPDSPAGQGEVGGGERG